MKATLAVGHLSDRRALRPMAVSWPGSSAPLRSGGDPTVTPVANHSSEILHATDKTLKD